jgi:hypothetical protein
MKERQFAYLLGILTAALWIAAKVHSPAEFAAEGQSTRSEAIYRPAR